ncbi:DgyrCDS10596 [Dimorphilus gyrociliatus]|uniref:DgyrCDS10596 n=1 Tax=Dimorphilus gyrociliatus TaxID=2664684 RepID=A0A7I8W1W4_9ANNE|nr:DgyrCDS10596 [Dimorphilus gyrociliatus]
MNSAAEDDYIIEEAERTLLPSQSTEKATEYETAISEAGYGRFHLKLLLLCGWAVSSDAIEVVCISFVLPSATCDFRMTGFYKGLLTAIIFLGMLFGGYIWGAISDIFGRRSTLLMSLLINSIGGGVSSLCQKYWMFLIFRLISGIGVGGALPVIFTYFCEFQPKAKRGIMISVLATCWMSGNIISAALACFYGLWMWFPEIFNKMEKYGGTVCSISHGNSTVNETQSFCDPISKSIYWEGLVVAAANLPGNIFTIFFIEKVGRRWLLSASMVASGLSAFAILGMKTRLHNILLSCLFSCISVVGWNALDVLNPELYPTELRSTATGFFSGVGRLATIAANLSFGLLVDIHCAIPLILVSGLLVFGGLSSLLLPETRNVDLH